MRAKIGFDVGACTGETICNFEGFDQIYVFEPSPYAFNILFEKYKNDSRIKFFQIGISNEDGVRKINLHNHYGYSSFLEIDKEGECAKKCEEEDSGYDEILSVIEVETKRIDTFMKENCIDHIDFLKIDTQGNDLNVIKSLGEMISKVDIIEAEVQIKPLYKNSPSKEEVLHFMQENNFDLVSEQENNPLFAEYERKFTFKRKLIDKIPIFDWGILDKEYIDLFSNENFINKVYEKHREVKLNDIVFDIGANYGSFTYSILHKKPKVVYCIEPSNIIIKYLQKNLSHGPVIFINKAISDQEEEVLIPESGVYIYNHEGDSYLKTTFEKIINKYGISKINFLKFDCEGGEYSIFTKNNYQFIRNNIENFAGEWHINDHKYAIERFIEFRNLYLNDCSDLHVYERNGKNITKEIFDDQYLYDFRDFWKSTYLGQFMIYFSYDSVLNCNF